MYRRALTLTGSNPLAYTPKVEPPLDEIEVEPRFPRKRDSNSKPYFIVSMECLKEILERETAVIATEDVPRLMAVLCRYAVEADVSDHHLAGTMQAYYEAITDDDAE